ncbi:MAG: sodium:proton exchanger, partial [Sphingomonas sanxanigenens]
GLFCVLASAAVMQWLHLSTALGAFIAGVMLADSPYRHELEADIEPFRAVLLGLFFVAVGMMLDLDAVVARPFFIVGMATALVATKAAIIFLIARVARMEWRTALALGLLLSQGGEFGFVLFAQAQKAMLIEPQAASLFGAIVTLSMATTPFLMMISRRFRGAPAKLRTDMEGPSSDGATAIVVGYGRFGQTVAQLLTAHKLAVTLIDWEAEQIDVSASFAVKVYYGDGRRVDLLRLAGASEAQLILFCQDGDPMEADHLATVAESFPDAKIFVRVFDRRQVIALYEAPIAGTVREVYESAIVMARQALEALDVEIDEIDDAEARYRDVDHQRLVAQAESGDLYAAREVMLRPHAGRNVADQTAT